MSLTQGDVLADALARIHVLPETPLARALTRCVEALLDDARVVEMPDVAGVACDVLARWLQRVCAAEGLLRPMHVIEARHARSEGDWELTTRGCWVCVVGDASAPALARLRGMADEGYVTCLTSGGETHDPGPYARAALLAWDTLHEPAIDPSLAHVRAALLAHCRVGGVVNVRGEHGSGRRALVEWARASLDVRDMSVFDAIEALDADHAERLRGALASKARSRSRAISMPALAARPVGPAFDRIVGMSRALVELLGRVEKIAPARVSVLVLGEPGVGKELVARALHEASGRTGPFVAVDAGTLTSEFAASALFGHVRGAFTGASSDRAGAFRSAHGGTLFIDEIGNLSPDLQIRLLRVLQERRVRPVGSDDSVEVDVRVVAATNQDIEGMCRRGLFRLDLLGRLNAATCRIPPLRERIGDLDVLARALLERAGRAPRADWCAPEVRALLEAHDWPGNVRELANVLELAHALAPEDAPIEVEHLGDLGVRMRSSAGALVAMSTPDFEPSEIEGLEPHLARLLSMTRIEVPPLRERTSASLTQAILSRLRGRPLSVAALRALRARPWWGNLDELGRHLEPLVAGDGVVTADELDAVVPGAQGFQDRSALHLIQSPVRTSAGITGARWTLDAPALIVGRIASLRELEVAHTSGDPRAGAWLDALRERVDGPCAIVSLPLMGRLSRAHVWVRRAPGGLAVGRFEQTGLRVMAGHVCEALVEIDAGAEIIVPDAAEVRVLHRDGSPYLQLFVFESVLAMSAHEEDALSRAQDVRRGTFGTQGLTVGARRSDSERTSARVWELTPIEVELITDLVACYMGGSFTRHIQTELAGLRTTPTYHRLVRYLDAAPRPPQYLLRLCEKAENAPVRDALRARFEFVEDRDARVAALPTGLRRILEGE